jgi:hypothetical protein
LIDQVLNLTEARERVERKGEIRDTDLLRFRKEAQLILIEAQNSRAWTDRDQTRLFAKLRKFRALSPGA